MRVASMVVAWVAVGTAAEAMLAAVEREEVMGVVAMEGVAATVVGAGGGEETAVLVASKVGVEAAAVSRLVRWEGRMAGEEKAAEEAPAAATVRVVGARARAAAVEGAKVAEAARSEATVEASEAEAASEAVGVAVVGLAAEPREAEAAAAARRPALLEGTKAAAAMVVELAVVATDAGTVTAVAATAVTVVVREAVVREMAFVEREAEATAKVVVGSVVTGEAGVTAATAVVCCRSIRRTWSRRRDSSSDGR